MGASSITIRYAETDDDIIAIHRFLCVMAGPTLPGDIGPLESVSEIHRVAHEEAALMAMKGDLLVGTLGIIRVPFWWNVNINFLVNRWFFWVSGTKAREPLVREGFRIAKGAGLELHLIDESRGTVKILNKSEKRHVLRQSTDHDDQLESDNDSVGVPDVGRAE